MTGPTTTWVFLGPTLPVADAEALLAATYRPPVAQGDVLRAVQAGVDTVGIIDGYFERQPAVWHKEILWALDQGVAVYGSSSMGALRAAELAAFGMVGVGAVYEDYARGRLTADDEVALLHGPPDSGYRPMSEALVNMRATLAAAVEEAIIAQSTASAVVRAAEATFYGDRNWERAVAEAHRLGAPGDELDALGKWLPTGRIDRKREDAEALLRLLGANRARGIRPPVPPFTFETSRFFDEARRAVEVEGATTVGALGATAVLEEICLLPGAHRAAGRAALLAHLSRQDARRHDDEVTDSALTDAALALRRERDLLEVEDLVAWQAARGMDAAGFEAVARDEALVRMAERRYEGEVQAGLGEQIRRRDDYPDLARRARDKEAPLLARGLAEPALADVGLSEQQLLEWYFCRRLRQDVPRDLTTWWVAAGFVDRDAFRRALLREYVYVELLD